MLTDSWQQEPVPNRGLPRPMQRYPWRTYNK